MELHSKTKGSIGELVALKCLYEHGIPVFTEYGDNSKVDLIALYNNVPIKIQVKAIKSRNGKVVLPKASSGPNYKYVYQNNEVDLFALYIPDYSVLCWILAEDMGKGGITLRVLDSKNNQVKNIHKIEDYSDLLTSLNKLQGSVV